MPIYADYPVLDGNTVLIDALWLNSAADLADMCAFVYTGPAINPNSTIAGGIRDNMGRKRIVLDDDESYESASVGLEECTPSQVDWLKAHIGQTVCVRDWAGSKWFGVYFEVPRELSTTPRHGIYLTDVKLTLTEVDHDEAV